VKKGGIVFVLPDKFKRNCCCFDDAKRKREIDRVREREDVGKRDKDKEEGENERDGWRERGREEQGPIL